MDDYKEKLKAKLKSKAMAKLGLNTKMRLKIKLICIAVVVGILLCACFYGVISGILEYSQEWLKKKVDGAVEAASNAEKYFNRIFGISNATAGMDIYIMTKDTVDDLKGDLENRGIDTEATGMTEIRLRKMLLAYGISNLYSDSLCVAPVTEEEILLNVNEKRSEEEKYKSMEELTDETNGLKRNNSNAIWSDKTMECVLYYDSKVFFYFKDTKGKIDEKKDQWYLGAMGAINITAGNETDMIYRDKLGFEALKTEYELSVKQGNKNGITTAKNDLLNSYTKGNKENTIKVWKLTEEKTKCNYKLENENIKSLELDSEDDGYKIEAVELDLNRDVNLAAYTISIELMEDLLNITGSGEFLETFIDFAINQTSVTLKAYPITATTTTYSKTEYNIKDDFILEAYDLDKQLTLEEEEIMMNLPDYEQLKESYQKNNFNAYKRIIFSRIYPYNKFNGRVTDLEKFEEIDYNGMLTLNRPGEVYKDLEELRYLLTTAYNPTEDFNLGEVKVTELKEVTKTENDWDVLPSAITTWYGNFVYCDPEIETNYIVANEDRALEEFNNYNMDSLKGYKTKKDETKEIIYILESLYNKSDENGVREIKKYEDSNSIINELNSNKGEHFDDWTVKGLGKIAEKTKPYNSDISNVNKDYIYAKYNKTNIKEYTTASKTEIENLNTSNVRKTTSNVETELKKFLILLKNGTGNIPNLPMTSENDEGGFSKNGKVVKYGDIYKGTIPAGDLLLDDGALMLFDLLDKSDNTQNLIDVFQYLAYLYTGVDHGVTSADEIAELLELGEFVPINGIVGNGTGWWWPIGSIETETIGGKLFASGTPALGKSDVSRAGKKTGTYSGSSAGPHSSSAGGWAVDIAARGIVGKYYAISIGKGKVIETDNSYTGFVSGTWRKSCSS